jgi:hypothetical protein
MTMTRQEELRRLAWDFATWAEVPGGRLRAPSLSLDGDDQRKIAAILNVAANEIDRWQSALPRCHWAGCPHIGVKWVGRTTLYCDDHGSQYLLDAPWADLVRSELMPARTVENMRGAR